MQKASGRSLWSEREKLNRTVVRQKFFPQTLMHRLGIQMKTLVKSVDLRDQVALEAPGPGPAEPALRLNRLYKSNIISR